jgi:hypothetical protein
MSTPRFVPKQYNGSSWVIWDTKFHSIDSNYFFDSREKAQRKAERLCEDYLQAEIAEQKQNEELKRIQAFGEAKNAARDAEAKARKEIVLATAERRALLIKIRDLEAKRTELVFAIRDGETLLTLQKNELALIDKNLEEVKKLEEASCR